jgi:hypothetical protein
MSCRDVTVIIAPSPSLVIEDAPVLVIVDEESDRGR